MNKLCKGCGETKDSSQFYTSKNTPDGLRCKCKKCIKAQGKAYRETNWEARLEYQRSYRRENNSEINRKRRVKYNSGESNEKEYYRNLRETSDYYTNYRKINKDKIRKVDNKRKQERYNTDPVYRLKISIRSQIKACYRKGWMYTERSRMHTIIGLSSQDLIHHLHSTFEATYGLPRECIKLSDVEIDHIIPLSTAQTVEDVRRLNHYTNLQLLFKEDNQAKGTKITLDFTPNLV